jgi:hypothetical protein
MVEAGVRYVKRNALQGRSEELTCWKDYAKFAVRWREEVANVRLHETTRERPVERFEQERPLLRPLPRLPFDTDEVVSAIVSPLARVEFDGNRYSTPPDVTRQTVIVRATPTHVRVIHQGREVACHARCYERGQLLRQPEHHLEALKYRHRTRASHIEQTWDALGPEAREFHRQLCQRPVKTTVHLRRLLSFVHLYGRDEVLAAIRLAQQYQTYDAAYVETLLLQERRRRELPPPMPLRLQRQELIDDIELEDPDPGAYDQLFQDHEPQEEKDHD